MVGEPDGMKAVWTNWPAPPNLCVKEFGPLRMSSDMSIKSDRGWNGYQPLKWLIMYILYVHDINSIERICRWNVKGVTMEMITMSWEDVLIHISIMASSKGNSGSVKRDRIIWILLSILTEAITLWNSVRYGSCCFIIVRLWEEKNAIGTVMWLRLYAIRMNHNWLTGNSSSISCAILWMLWKRIWPTSLSRQVCWSLLIRNWTTMHVDKWLLPKQIVMSWWSMLPSILNRLLPYFIIYQPIVRSHLRTN